MQRKVNSYIGQGKGVTLPAHTPAATLPRLAATTAAPTEKRNAIMATPRNSQPAAEVPAAAPSAEENGTTTAPAEEVTAPTAPTMPERPDWTAPTIEMSTALAGEVKSLTDAVEAWKARTTAVDVYANALRAHTRNMKLATYDASYRAASLAGSAEEGWAQLLVELDQNIAYVVDRLSPTALNADLVKGEGLAGKLRKILDNADMFIAVSDEAQTTAGLAIAAWQEAAGKYRAAAGNQKPASYQTTTAPAGVSAPSRGVGELVRTRGFELVMQCNDPSCKQHGDPLTSGSNKGSAQDAMKNHYAAPAHKLERPMANTPEHVAFTTAMNAVLAADAPAEISQEGGLFTISRRYVAA